VALAGAASVVDQKVVWARTYTPHGGGNMHRKVAAALVAALALGLGTAGCGGTESLSRAELARRSDTICRRAQRRGQALMREASAMARGGARFDDSAARSQISSLLRDMADDLDELAPPDELEDQFDDFIAIQRKRADAIVSGGEPDGGAATNHRSATLVHQFGFRVCS
jgi:hypothetical protein